VLSVYYEKNVHKICITPLVCSLHVPKIIEFYLCIEMLPAKCKWLHFSWATLYVLSPLILSSCMFIKIIYYLLLVGKF